MTLSEFQQAITGGMSTAGYTRNAKHPDFDFSFSATKGSTYSVKWSRGQYLNQTSGGPAYNAMATIFIYNVIKSADEADTFFSDACSAVDGIVAGITAADSSVIDVRDEMIGELIQRTTATISALLED